MKYIDLENYGRKNQYNNFIHYSNPIVSVCTTLDVTYLVKYCKSNKMSFFICYLYIVTKCINSIDEMKLRIKNDKPVIYNRVNPSYVVLCDNDELRTHRTLFDNDFYSFYQSVKNDIEVTRKTVQSAFNVCNDNNCIYVSCLPWIEFNSVTNPYDFNDKEQSSIPRITWGKYYYDNENIKMNFDVSAHHALVDGIHIAKLVSKIQDELNCLSFLEENK